MAIKQNNIQLIFFINLLVHVGKGRAYCNLRTWWRYWCQFVDRY